MLVGTLNYTDNNYESAPQSVVFQVAYIFTETQLMLSPSEVARVCPGGDLAITCSTDGSFLEWNITPSFTIPGQPNRTRLVFVSQDLEPIVLNMISFDFSHSTHEWIIRVTGVSFISH